MIFLRLKSHFISFLTFFKFTALVCLPAFLLATFWIKYRGQNDLIVIQSDKKTYVREGAVPQGQVCEHIFKIKNVDATRTAEVFQIQMGCSCTSVVMSRSKLLPGEVAEYKIRVDTRDRKDDLYALSTLTWKYLNESSLQYRQIGLIVHVVDILKMDPLNISFGAIPDSDLISSQNVTLRRGELKLSWDSIRVESTNPSLKSEITQLNSNTYLLKVSVDPLTLPIGPVSSELKICCYSGKERLSHSFVIPVSGRRVSDIESKPLAVYFGAIPSGQLVKRAFTLSSPKKINFISIQSSKSACATATPLNKAGNDLNFECLFNSKGLRDNQGGQFLVTVQDGSLRKLISVPFIAYVQ